MEEFITLFVNNGTAIACLIYFMWYNNTTMKEFTEQMRILNSKINLLSKDTSED